MRQDQINFYTYNYLVVFQTQQDKGITLNAIDHIKEKQKKFCSQ